MKKLVFILGLLITVLGARSQDLVVGQLVDAGDGAPVPFAHVTNYGTNLMTVTGERGFFRIPAVEGDTIVFSIVGYETLGWIVDETWEGGEKKLRLPQDTVLLNDVTISNIPTEEVFKQRIRDYQPEDTAFWYHGMPKPQEKSDPMLDEKNINNPLFALTQPADFLYQKFSKKAKEKRKYHQIIQSESRRNAIYDKFSREWVGEMTDLKGDELTDFIQYCNYSLDYLEETPLYVILEDMLAKLETFQKNGNG